MAPQSYTWTISQHPRNLGHRR